MLQSEKINSFIALGKFLSQFKQEETKKDTAVLQTERFFEQFIDLIHLSQSHNGWFTPEHVYFAIQSWSNALSLSNFDFWLKDYDFDSKKPKTVALILAGNIPLVGFHDFLSVLISGNKVLVRTSSNDQKLLPFLANYLIAIEPQWENFISFTEEKLEGFEAVIATGSNNTARYFEYYFKEKPSIIRKSRNSVAILTGEETKEDLENLGEDIFRYFGLGCRNVSKLYVPKNYDFAPFFEAIFKYKEVLEYEKYCNNYDYNKAVFLMSNFKLRDNGFLTLKEDTSMASPISSVFYEYYDSITELKATLVSNKDSIQCIVSKKAIDNSIPFGKTQMPELWDYADGINTLEFLSKI
ncbi:MAG: hypothetical protein ACI9XR_000983 [Flavobacterium sp.]|jgi:hypothetical protein